MKWHLQRDNQTDPSDHINSGTNKNYDTKKTKQVKLWTDIRI